MHLLIASLIATLYEDDGGRRRAGRELAAIAKAIMGSRGADRHGRRRSWQPPDKYASITKTHLPGKMNKGDTVLAVNGIATQDVSLEDVEISLCGAVGTTVTIRAVTVGSKKVVTSAARCTHARAHTHTRARALSLSLTHSPSPALSKAYEVALVRNAGAPDEAAIASLVSTLLPEAVGVAARMHEVLKRACKSAML